jgi:hypothetical protein
MVRNAVPGCRRRFMVRSAAWWTHHMVHYLGMDSAQRHADNGRCRGRCLSEFTILRESMKRSIYSFHIPGVFSIPLLGVSAM